MKIKIRVTNAIPRPLAGTIGDVRPIEPNTTPQKGLPPPEKGALGEPSPSAPATETPAAEKPEGITIAAETPVSAVIPPDVEIKSESASPAAAVTRELEPLCPVEKKTPAAVKPEKTERVAAAAETPAAEKPEKMERTSATAEMPAPAPTPPAAEIKSESVSPAAEAASAAVARELERLRPVEKRTPAAVKPEIKERVAAGAEKPAPAATPPVVEIKSESASSAARIADLLSAPDFGLEDEPGLSAIQTRFKILIVDDDPIIVRLLTHFLVKSNYDVKSVTEGMEGLKIAFAEKPDLILLDVMMPGMDGFRFLELLKKGKRFANVPVLMISALVEEDQVLRALEAGATDYIVKPFSSRIVLAKVHKALKDLT